MCQAGDTSNVALVLHSRAATHTVDLRAVPSGLKRIDGHN